MTEQQTLTPPAPLPSTPVEEPQQATVEVDQPAPQAGHEKKSPLRIFSLIRSITCWFDNSTKTYNPSETDNKYSIDWLRMIPYVGMHVMCLGVIWVGWSPVAVAVAAGLYAFHMFVITGFYHRYFSHRTFKTSRTAQFIFAVAGASCVQRGAIWWAARHRHHHRHSDEEDDIHSPIRHGFYFSHVGWIVSKAGFDYDEKAVPDLMKFPELC